MQTLMVLHNSHFWAEGRHGGHGYTSFPAFTVDDLLVTMQLCLPSCPGPCTGAARTCPPAQATHSSFAHSGRFARHRAAGLKHIP